jgi:hypothetical protein
MIGLIVIAVFVVYLAVSTSDCQSIITDRPHRSYS